MGIKVFAPYERTYTRKKYGEFAISQIELQTIDGSWTHTDADGEPCPIYGFHITHKEMGKMLYITDCEVVKWRFKGINHMLLGVDYDKNMVDMSNPAKASHVFRGHMSIDTACKFVSTNYSPDVQNIIMCHLSEENADKDNFIEQMKKVAKWSNVDVAEPYKEWELRNQNVAPF